MPTTWFLLGAFLYLASLCDGHLFLENGYIGIDLTGRRSCSPDIIHCGCGESNYPISVSVPTCRYQFLWIIKCTPCQDHDKDPEIICQDYELCEQCHSNGGDSCVSCPRGKFGNWCEYTCTCENGGTCDRSGNCICPSSHEGRNCEKEKFFCTCQNGGTCDQSGNCICPPSYEGRHCEKQKVFCTCQNGGTCNSSGNCICPPSYEGKHCEKQKVCGRSGSSRSPFIFNGKATQMGQWPWQAGIAEYSEDYNRWSILCGGSLINELFVITAAHCVTHTATTSVIEPDNFQVYLGKYHRRDIKDDEYVQVRQIQEIHIHPDYDPFLLDADIALLQLDSAVQLNSRVQPVCLPTEQTTQENIVEGKLGVVTGWGMTEIKTYSETLKQAVLPVVLQNNCEKGYEESDLPLTVTDNMFCAGYKEGKRDICIGDSGGPMVFLDESSKEKKWFMEGITSWGSPRGCGMPKQYGGFTTVSRFLDWIHLYF